MNLERYEFDARKTLLEYEFVSEGPNGRVIKMVRFYLKIVNGLPFFHLAFGDWNEKRRQIDDLSRTNNNDVKKILATVATIVLVFTEQFGDVIVFVEGSTQARTRLYQMKIIAHYQEIKKFFDIYGYKNYEWQLFKKGVNYEALAIRRK